MIISGFKLIVAGNPTEVYVPLGSPLVAARNLALRECERVDVWLMEWRGSTSGDERIGSFAPDGSVCG